MNDRPLTCPQEIYRDSDWGRLRFGCFWLQSFSTCLLARWSCLRWVIWSGFRWAFIHFCCDYPWGWTARAPFVRATLCLLPSSPVISPSALKPCWPTLHACLPESCPMDFYLHEVPHSFRTLYSAAPFSSAQSASLSSRKLAFCWSLKDGSPMDHQISFPVFPQREVSHCGQASCCFSKDWTRFLVFRSFP